jgi:hypothetical protein
VDVMNAQALALFSVPLIAKAAESLGDSLLGKVADEAVASGWEKVAQAVVRVRAWFHERNDEDGEEVLRGVVKRPTSESRAAELADALQGRFEQDPDLAADVQRLLDAAAEESAAQAPAVHSFVTTVRDNAKVGRLTTIGTINARNVRF